MQQEEITLQGIMWWGLSKEYYSDPVPQDGGKALLVPPLSSSEIAPGLLHSHPDLQHSV